MKHKLFKIALSETHKYAQLMHTSADRLAYTDVSRAIRESAQFKGIRSADVQTLAESVVRHLKESVMSEIDLAIRDAKEDGLDDITIARELAEKYGMRLPDAQRFVAQWVADNQAESVTEATSALAQWKQKVKAAHPTATFEVRKKTDRYGSDRVEANVGHRMVGYFEKKSGRSNVLEAAEKSIKVYHVDRNGKEGYTVVDSAAALQDHIKGLKRTGAKITHTASIVDGQEGPAVYPKAAQVDENFSGAIAETSFKVGDKIRTIKMGQTPGVIEKIDGDWVIFRHESGKLYRAPLSNVRIDESLSGRSSFDRAHQRFKHDELAQELKGEDQYYQKMQAQQTGKWYIRIDGRVWRKNGQPVEFNGRNHANNAALTVQKRSPRKIVTLTTIPADVEKHRLFKEDVGDAAAAYINKIAYSKVHPNNIGRFRREATGYLENNRGASANILKAGLMALAYVFAKANLTETDDDSEYQTGLDAAQEILRQANQEYRRTGDRSVLDRAHREYGRVYDQLLAANPEAHSRHAAKRQVWGPAGTNESAGSVIDSYAYNNLIDQVPDTIKRRYGIDAVARATERAVDGLQDAATVQDVLQWLKHDEESRSEAEDWHELQRLPRGRW